MLNNQVPFTLLLQGICGVEPGSGYDGVSYSLSILCLAHTLVLGFNSREALLAWDARVRYGLGEGQSLSGNHVVIVDGCDARKQLNVLLFRSESCIMLFFCIGSVIFSSFIVSEILMPVLYHIPDVTSACCFCVLTHNETSNLQLDLTCFTFDFLHSAFKA